MSHYLKVRFIDMALAIQIVLKFKRGADDARGVGGGPHSRGKNFGRPLRQAKGSFFDA
jgi:hypothetical protein